MAFTLGNGSSGRRRFGASNHAMAEINIVPLVDVVLVLLIIFMLTAHVMEFGLEVEVPAVKVTSNSAEELPVVTVTRKGDMLLNGKPVNIHEIGARVKSQFKDSKGVYVMADRRTPWDPIAQVIAELGDAKLSVKVVTKPDESGGK